MAAHPMLLEAKRQAEKLPRYKIKRTNTGQYRLWRLYDEWKPIHEFSTQDQAEEYLLAKLPAIESEL